MTPMAASASKPPAVELEVDDRVVRISNPDRVYFPATGATKLDLAEYYLSVGDGIVAALLDRPCMLHRFPEGVAGEKVHQKRVPHGAPPISSRHSVSPTLTRTSGMRWRTLPCVRRGDCTHDGGDLRPAG